MSTMSMLAALNQALRLEMERDEDVILLGQDIGFSGGVFGVTKGLQSTFGRSRVRDTPISESAMLGAAAGAAATGLRPVVELMFVDFIGVAFDQLFNQAAKMRYMSGGQISVPMVMRATCGVTRVGSGAQHSQCLEAWFMHVPGLKVVMPSTPYDAKGLLTSAIRDENPVVFLENKMLYAEEGEVPEESYTIPLGKADIKRAGGDVTVVATGRMVHEALKAAELLAREGVDVEVLDPRCLLPLDEEAILESVRKTHRLVIVHEEVKFAGSGAEIAAMVAERAIGWLDGPVLRVGGAFCPVPTASKMEAAFLPRKENIADAVRTVMKG